MPLPGQRPQFKVVSHSELFYFWPIWALGIVMAAISFVQGSRLAILPEGTRVNAVATDQGPDRFELTVPGKPTDSLNRAAAAAPGQAAFPDRVVQNTALQLIYVIVAIVVILATAVTVHGLWSGYSAYTASKAAVSMLTKTLAQEAAPHGVRVVAVAPGAIRTPINRSVWSDPKSLQDLRQKILLNRIGDPEEVARIVVVLVSEVASYVTGRTVFVDGGMTDYPDFARGG
jgi:hypothetical protein